MICSNVSWRSSGLCSPSIFANSSSTSRWSTMSSAMTSSSGWCSGMSGYPLGSVYGLELDGRGGAAAPAGGLQSFARPPQGLADQAGHLHLGDADVVGDL